MINKISLIVSTYNQPEYLALTLQSVREQQGIDFQMLEVIIADDGSTNETRQLIAQMQLDFSCEIKHIWHVDDGFRKSEILNKSVAQSVGDYLVFIDGDCVVPVDFIANQIKLAEHGFFVAGNRVLLSEKYTRDVLMKNISLGQLKSFEWIKLYVLKKSNKLLHFLRVSNYFEWRKSRKTNWKFPKGCNIAIWRENYYAVNGYDESFSGWGHEDADFFVRLLHNDIYIKDGRFSVPVFHLWHKLNSRENEEINMQKLLARVSDKSIIRARSGLDKHV